MRTVLLVVFCCYAGWASAVQYLADNSFESPSGVWAAYGSGYVSSTVGPEDGTKSIYCSTTSTSATFGASQVAVINQGVAAPLLLSGWSKSTTTVSGSNDANYAIYADVTYQDGTHLWGVNAPFPTGAAQAWNFQSVVINPTQPISSVSVYALFRSHSGTVYFDNFSLTPAASPTASPTTAPTPNLKIMFPLYVYPGSIWNSVKAQASNVSITVIANPNSGPGSSLDSTYSTYIGQMVSAGVKVIGYVHTSYAARATADVEADILSWKTWYGSAGVSGIFLDEASNDPTKVSYYQTLQTYIQSQFTSSAFTVLNPGTSAPDSYLTACNDIVYYESTYAGFVSGVSMDSTLSYHTTAMTHTTNSTSYQSAVDKARSRGYGYVFVTDDVLPNPYDTLPTYWTALVAYIKAHNV